MNIGFDSIAILGPMSKNRGIGNYALSQFSTMINIDKENNYFFLNLLEDYSLHEYIANTDNLKETYLYCGKDNFLLKDASYEDVIGDIIKSFIKKNNIDVFYITSPFESNFPIYKKEWFEGIKVVATVYDIIPYVLKDKYLTDRNTYKWYMKCVDMLKWVDKCLVISKSVKDDMVKYLGFDKAKITVIHGAVNESYKKIEICEKRKDEIFSKFGIIDKFIMCTGGDDERKNIKELIIAYSKMGQDLINKYQLVIVCKLSVDSINKYTKVIEDNNVKGRVILTNFVTNEELLMLYNLAHLMAFPSKYEGFGLPVVEAFACGTPVLTSNNSSLGEIAEGAAILVNPYNTKDITRGLVGALTNTDLDELIKQGFKKLELYKWETVAEITIKELKNLDINKNDIFEKRKIAFFTPLPPIKSGISDYSVDILNALSVYFDIDVYIDNGYSPNCELNSQISIYNHNQFIKNCNEYFDVIYQVGNSEYHVYMWDYIRRYKGTVVLHDYNLHGVAQFAALHKNNDEKQYKEILLYDYESDVVNDYIEKLHSGNTHIKIYDMETNGFITNHANKIIVHSNEAKEKLLKKDIHRNVRTINSYAKIEPLVDNNKIKSNMQIDHKTIIMASFGHIHETKRAIPLLNAFNRFIKNNNNINIIYYFVGKLDPGIKPRFETFIKENQLENKVIVTGYTELDEFVKYIDLADICFNLRYPYNGETSGSLMRILAKGKCVVVNDIGSFGEIPDECCIKLPSVEEMSSEDEIESIYNAMEELINENKRKILSRNARKFAEENLDINIVAKQYADFIYNSNRPVLTDKMVLNISKEISSQNYSTREILQLSKTLAYSKNCIDYA
jgi:glycosyltransferase involved in cell wall biosynthesis